MIFNENGVIINNPNIWVENVNRDIDELNSIIESIQIDYLHEGANLKEIGHKFIKTVKKIFALIKQKLIEIKNLIKNKLDPLINKIKSNKDKIANNFNKLSKEQKEKLFKNNSVNESYYLHESSGSFEGDPKNIVNNFKTAIDYLFKIQASEDLSYKDMDEFYKNELNIFKKYLISNSNNDENFAPIAKEYFEKLRYEFYKLDIDDIINIATDGNKWVSDMDKYTGLAEKELVDRMEELESKAKDGTLFISYKIPLESFLHPALRIVNAFTVYGIEYMKKIVSESGRICNELLNDQ